ncbi:unannotated protein [freshwater metagenome]|uniref:Unannotated protein n=1 Tax=freshwater metagenome TaxID=449393 RepID=A0A6J6FU68_9ZZZZ|nr:hypothetical protein [Actinomycetota bacterium]
MGFSEGLEDEFLLTCFVCKSPFGMLALFCGECGCKRDQALGIERASTRQQIINNELLIPSFVEQAPDVEAIPEGAAYFATPSPSTAPAAPTPKRESVKKQMRRQNRALRIESLSNFQERHARALNLSGTVLFLMSTYMLVQSFIFSQSNPLATTQTLLELGSQRNSAYFQQLGADENTKKFPTTYLRWDASTATDWLTGYTVNGWLGKATVWTIPGSSELGDERIEMQLKPEYTTVYGIFRQINWVPSNPPATIELTYPSDPNTAIYINGLAAGTVRNPTIKEGTYLLYPGPFDVRFYQNGTDSVYSFYYFIDAYGEYSNY